MAPRLVSSMGSSIVCAVLATFLRLPSVRSVVESPFVKKLATRASTMSASMAAVHWEEFEDWYRRGGADRERCNMQGCTSNTDVAAAVAVQ